MLERLTAFERREIDLGQLIRDLRGLYIEADPHDATIRSNFESHWSPIDGEYEMRTESQPPASPAHDDHLADALGQFRSWVKSVLSADTSAEHR